MDKTSTTDFTLSENLIKKALKGDLCPSPSKSSLEFIKNFARNYRAKQTADGIMIEYMLN